jgi:ABC-2 type transport system ATP-binding protein
MNPVLEVKNLLKQFFTQVVVNEVNINFFPGQFIALVGKNSSGKSAFMKLLSQREPFTDGNIYFNNRTLRSPRTNYLAEIVYITEDNKIPIHRSIAWWKEQLEKSCLQYDQECFSKLEKSFKLDLSRKFDTLSRGQKMKAYFALQAPRHPKVYLLDEITAIMDSGSRLAILKFLKSEVEAGALVIMVTNVASELQGFANHICVIDDGKLELFSSSKELGTHFEKYRAFPDSVGDADSIDENTKLRKVLTNSDGSWSMLRKREGDPPLPTMEIDRRDVTIEDVAVFYTLAGGGD